MRLYDRFNVLYISSAIRLRLDLVTVQVVVMVGTTCVVNYKQAIDPSVGGAAGMTPGLAPRTTRGEGPVPEAEAGGTGLVGGAGAGDGTTPGARTRRVGESLTSGTHPRVRMSPLPQRNEGLGGVGGACLVAMATCVHGIRLRWVKGGHAVRTQTGGGVGGGGGGVVPGLAPRVGPDVATPPPPPCQGSVAGLARGPGACRASGHDTVTGRVQRTAALKTRSRRNRRRRKWPRKRICLDWTRSCS